MSIQPLRAIQSGPGKQVTRWVILLAVAALIVYDFVAVYLWGEPATLSRQVQELGAAHGVILFASGFLCGHLFWYQRVPDPKE